MGRGKIVEKKFKGSDSYAEWKECAADDLYDFINYEYRIKPEPHHRPFRSAEECWAEMQKHQPFGWVKGIHNEHTYVQVQYVVDSDDLRHPIFIHFAPDEEYNEKESFDNYTFADGAPFGIQEEA